MSRRLLKGRASARQAACPNACQCVRSCFTAVIQGPPSRRAPWSGWIRCVGGRARHRSISLSMPVQVCMRLAPNALQRATAQRVAGELAVHAPFCRARTEPADAPLLVAGRVGSGGFGQSSLVGKAAATATGSDPAAAAAMRPTVPLPIWASALSPAATGAAADTNGRLTVRSQLPLSPGAAVTAAVVIDDAGDGAEEFRTRSRARCSCAAVSGFGTSPSMPHTCHGVVPADHDMLHVHYTVDTPGTRFSSSHENCWSDHRQQPTPMAHDCRSAACELCERPCVSCTA